MFSSRLGSETLDGIRRFNCYLKGHRCSPEKESESILAVLLIQCRCTMDINQRSALNERMQSEFIFSHFYLAIWYLHMTYIDYESV